MFEMVEEVSQCRQSDVRGTTRSSRSSVEVALNLGEGFGDGSQLLAEHSHFA